MSWNMERAQKRIEKHIKRAPEISEEVSTLSEHRRIVRQDIKAAYARGEFPRSRAVVVEGVQMYGLLLDFENYIADQGGVESENSHKNMLSFLDAHYSIWDSLVEDGGGFTVDFHGPRLHAVIAESGLTPQEQIERAIALADKLSAAADEIGRSIGYASRTRFGIDFGTCIALTTGRSHETDTLFLGSPANYAAKITEAENLEGIFLSPKAQQHVQATPAFGEYGSAHVMESVVSTARQLHRFETVDAALEKLVSTSHKPPNFSFYRPKPPLSRMRFGNLKPSKTAHLGIASMFADIDGYTAYVDDAISSGLASIKTAITAIHVIREELNDVLKDDFGGKRVRFIGDCIHGLIAEGDNEDDPNKAVEQSLYCASAMRSSFVLVQNILGKLDMIDLAVGVEYGPVSVTRIGNRGDASIRCSSGRAVILSERVQKSILGGGIQLGDTAAIFAPTNAVKGYLNVGHIPEYDDALNLLGSVMAPAIQIIHEDPTARPYLGDES